MQLQIPLSEITDIVKAKYGVDVMLQAISEKTFRVGYYINILIGKKLVTVDLTVKDLKDEVLYLNYASEQVTIDFILKGLLKFLPSFVDMRIIERRDGNRLAVHLEQIEQVHNALQQIDVVGICFDATNAIIDFHMKM